ncbi:HD-GYP domain-containing protein [Salipaludibacillus daqingensis]|uniref:HD-GYP domain-containing protein n=1 Tax=Salipaludibacillus daqingensis TaxID=3041001 RepID=UPI0024768029|nr:HD-GYP domain-containing protein [Salipaludibacillus daqingensis]
MKLKSIHSVYNQDRLAKPIYNDLGQTLLNSGVILTDKMIDRLKNKGVSYVYIEDASTEDIYVEDTIHGKTRMKALKTIQGNFNTISNQMALGKSVDIDKLSPSFSNLVKEILLEIQSKKEVISMLSEVVSYDSYVFHHSLNVTVYAVALGQKVGLNQSELHDLGLGAMLHDLGKMGIPLEILNKSEELTVEEFDLIKSHASIGFDMLRKSYTLSLITAHCAYQHHERLDGTGYPRQLAGNDIHYFAKIIGIADVFDAVTSNRVYRQAMLPHEGLELLYSGAGSLFDEKLVDSFAKTVAIYPVGLEVRLSNGEEGVVAKINAQLPSRPVIRVLKDKDKNRCEKDIDLSVELNVTIIACETAIDQYKKVQ